MTKQKFYYLDSHFHLDDERFDGIRKQVITRAQKKEIKYFLSPLDTVRKDSNIKEVINLSGKTDNYYIAFGIHPHEAKYYNSKTESRIIELVKSNKNTVAIGEIGLDYYYNFSSPKEQKIAFESQLDIAEKLNLPVIIHIRDAFNDVKDILFKRNIRGVLHSYTGTTDFLKIALKYNYYISFSGMLTFKNADSIREAFLKTPLSSLLLETDSPYLAPEPKRGKQNEPSFVTFIYKKASELLNIDENKLKHQIENNFKQLFLSKSQ